MRTHPVDKFLGQHCYKSAAGLLQYLRFYVCSTHETGAQVVTSLQVCSQAVDNLCWHCLFPVAVTSLEQAVNNL